MKKYFKGLIFIGVALVLAIIGFVLNGTDYAGYSVLCFTGAVVLLILGISSVFTSNNPTKVYEAKVRNILNTYDSILVQSNKIPSLEGRNVVNVEKMEDLVDAQLELRKPICYLKQTESCSFLLLDEKEAYVYIEKLNDDVISPVEIELKELKIKERDRDDMDSEMLKGIDKTTVVKLSNRKSYKVSPIRKKTEGDEKVDLTTIMPPVTEADEPKFQVIDSEVPEVPQPEEVKVPDEAPVVEEQHLEEPAVIDSVPEEKKEKVKEDLEVI